MTMDDLVGHRLAIGFPRNTWATALPALLVGAALVAPRPAHADPAPGFYQVTWTYDTRPTEPNTFAATEDGRSWWVRLGDRVTPTDVTVWSDSTAPGPAQLFMRFPGPTCGRVALSLGAAPLLSAIARIDGSGPTGSPYDCLFFQSLDATQLRAVLALPPVTQRDVSTLGTWLTATFAASPTTLRSGGRVSVDLTMTAPPGSPRIARWTTGPLDSPFTLDITRAGRPVRQRDMVMGGRGVAGFVVMGAEARDSMPISEIWDVTARGHYVVQCRYDARFNVPSSAYESPARQGVTRTFTGRVEFDVR
jgi:hypothetical protein